MLDREEAIQREMKGRWKSRLLILWMCNSSDFVVVHMALHVKIRWLRQKNQSEKH